MKNILGAVLALLLIGGIYQCARVKRTAPVVKNPSPNVVKSSTMSSTSTKARPSLPATQEEPSPQFEESVPAPQNPSTTNATQSEVRAKMDAYLQAMKKYNDTLASQPHPSQHSSEGLNPDPKQLSHSAAPPPPPPDPTILMPTPPPAPTLLIQPPPPPTPHK